MKTKIKFLFTLIFALTILFVKAQTITKVMNNEKLNYFEKIRIIEDDKKSILKNAEDWEAKRYMRWRTFWDTRVDKDGSIITYINEWHKQVNKRIKNKGKSGHLPQWHFVGPNEMPQTPNYMGRMESVTSDPQNQNIIYAGSCSGGLFKCENPTAPYPHWENLTDDYFGMGVWDIIVHPENSDIIYIVTGTYANGLLQHGYYSLGVYKTTDGGQTWNPIMRLEPEELIFLSALAMDPSDYNTLYALAAKTVYKTTDGGQTWENLYVRPDDSVSFHENIVIKPYKPDEIFISGSNGLYKTENGGGRWSRITNLGCGSETRIAIAYNPADAYIYALYMNSDTYGTIKKTNNGGSSWIPVINNTFLYIRDYIYELEISPNGNIYAGGRNIYKSPYNDIDFEIQRYMHADIRDIHFPNRNDTYAFIATDGGIVMNTTGGNNDWFSINGDLCASQFYSFAISDNNPELIIGGTHDCGTIRKSVTGSWSHVFGCDGGNTLIDYSDRNNVFAMCNKSILRSTQGGSSFDFIGLKSILYNTPMLQNPQFSNIVYIAAKSNTTGGSAIFKSENSGASFDDPEDLFGYFWGTITAMAINKSNPDIFYFATDNRFWGNQSYLRKTTDNGLNWTSCENGFGNAIIEGRIMSILVHPNKPETVYVAFGNFVDNHVFITNDGGSNWHNYSKGLPNLPANQIIIDEETETLYLATDAGMYYKTSGQIWLPFNNGLPSTIITEIKINKNTREMIISTYGRGIWKTELGCSDSQVTMEVTSDQTWVSDIKLCGGLEITNNATLTISSNLNIPDDKDIIIDNGTLIIDDGGSIKDYNSINWSGTMIVKNGGKLILKDGSIIKMYRLGKIIFEHNSKFEYHAGAELHLISDFNYVDIKGDLDLKENAVFIQTTNGYIKISGRITAEPGASIYLNGRGNNDKILEIDNYSIKIPTELCSFKITNGKIIMTGDNAQIKTTSVNTDVYLKNIKLTSSNGHRTNHKGIYINRAQNVTINNCVFENGKYGIYSYRAGSDANLNITNTTFNDCFYGLYTYGRGANLSDCTFSNCTFGWYARSMSRSSYCNSSQFINNSSHGIKFYGYSSSGLYLDYCNIDNNTYGVYIDGSLIINVECGSISNNSSYGIKLIHNASINLSPLQSPSSGIVDISNNKYAIYASDGNCFYLNNGKNNLRPNNFISGSMAMYGRFMNMYGTVTANNNLWNSTGTAPIWGTDYKLYGGLIINYDKMVILTLMEKLTLLDNNPLKFPFFCDGPGPLPGSSTSGTRLSDDSFSPYSENMEVRKINTNHFNKIKLNKAVGQVIDLLSEEEINNIIEIDQLLHEILMFPYPNINIKEKWYVDLAYSLYRSNSGNIDIPTHPGIYNKLHHVNDKLLTAVNNSEWNKEKNKLYLTVNKAHTYRMAGEYNKAFKLIENLMKHVNEEDYIVLNEQLCVLLTEKAILDGIISPEDFEQVVEACYCNSSGNKSGKAETSINDEINTINNKLTIYPNPVTGTSEIKVSLNEEQKGEIRIYNITGQKLRSINLKLGDNHLTIVNNELNSGIYQVVLFINNQLKESHKMVIIR
ncbi:MAG: right-handed parallel beta-helix repeat-containing protein [Bacteroidales bacterium]|nr:right-handed parallel beta-helix repeat-containing protein [Bacteroidales bacterium]